MKRFSNRSWIFTLLILFAVLALGFWQFKGGGIGGNTGGRSGKRYGRVKRGDLEQKVTVSGQIFPFRRTIFVAPYTGYVRQIFVKVGQAVKKGEPVISVVSSLMSPEAVFPIRAPFAGTVVEVPKSEGEFVTEKDAKEFMVRIDDLSQFFVVAKAPELDATRIVEGMEVNIRVSALKDANLKGVVKRVDLAAQEADGWRQQQATFEVRVEVLHPPKELRSGQTAVLDIVTNRFKDVLYLEHEFINQEGKKYFVVTRSGERKPIEIGNQTDASVEVKGLSEGDEVEQIDFLKLLEKGG